MNLWKNTWTPMLLAEKQKPFQNPDYLYEIKFDGIRAILFITPQKIIIKSRNGKDITHLFPELQEIKNIVTKNIIFDGEIVLFEKNRPSFSKILERLHQKSVKQITLLSKINPVIYMCFDLLYEEKNITKLPLIKRKKILENYPDTDNFCKVKTFENGPKLWQQVKKFNLEGIVAKKKTSIYEINTRTDDWIKIKKQNEEIFYIVGYIEKENSAVISLLLGEKKNNQLKYVGKVSMAKKNPFYKKLKKQRLRKTSALKEIDEKANFITPKYLCSIKYLEKTAKGMIRHPIFQKIIN